MTRPTQYIIVSSLYGTIGARVTSHVQDVIFDAVEHERAESHTVVYEIEDAKHDLDGMPTGEVGLKEIYNSQKITE